MSEGTGHEMTDIFNEIGIKPNIQFTVENEQAIMAMVSNGLGISLMPELMLENTVYDLKKYRLPKSCTRDIGICVKDKNSISNSTRKFIDFTIEWVRANVK